MDIPTSPSNRTLRAQRCQGPRSTLQRGSAGAVEIKELLAIFKRDDVAPLPEWSNATGDCMATATT
jgi:hypothetical protein